jgi:3-deoxy-D-manno-octulosonate 8-phosphate phosphatase (KDO 8-P phosphatase)
MAAGSPASIYLENVPENVLRKAREIRLLALDVDGVMTDGRLYFSQSGEETKAFSTRDGMGIKALQRGGITVALITGRRSAMVDQRAGELRIEQVFQGSDDKLQALLALQESTGLELPHIAYMGDDWVDLPVLQRVGFSATVADAEPLVRRQVDWVTAEAGGQGAVRAICNLILAAQGKLDEQLRGYMAS